MKKPDILLVGTLAGAVGVGTGIIGTEKEASACFSTDNAEGLSDCRTTHCDTDQGQENCWIHVFPSGNQYCEAFGDSCSSY